MIRLASIASDIDLAWNRRLSKLLVIAWTLLIHSPLGLSELTKATADKSIFNILIATKLYIHINSITVYANTSQYNDVIMSAMASQITNLTIVYSSVYSGADQRKHQSSAQRASNAENGSIWWRHHAILLTGSPRLCKEGRVAEKL